MVILSILMIVFIAIANIAGAFVVFKKEVYTREHSLF